MGLLTRVKGNLSGMQAAAMEASEEKRKKAAEATAKKRAATMVEQQKAAAKGRERIQKSSTLRGAITIGSAVVSGAKSGAKAVGTVASKIDVDKLELGATPVKTPARKRKTPTKKRKTPTKKRKTPTKKKVDPMWDFGF